MYTLLKLDCVILTINHVSYTTACYTGASDLESINNVVQQMSYSCR